MKDRWLTSDKVEAAGLDQGDQRSLALWAAHCAEHVLPCFEESYPDDERLRTAIEAGRAWVRGEITVGAARAAAVAAHAAARDADEGAARAAARAAGHAAGTAHMAGHARHAAAYAVEAATLAAAANAGTTASTTASAASRERDWQYQRLSEHLRPVALFARTDDIVLRPATSGDTGAIAEVYLESFHATYNFPLGHTDEQVRRWIADMLLPAREVWVAATRARTIVACMALTPDMLDQLYVAPGWEAHGIGSRLVALAKVRRPAGLDLYTFQVNANARQFYQWHGFVEVWTGDGSDNDEGQPDVRYAWRPART